MKLFHGLILPAFALAASAAPVQAQLTHYWDFSSNANDNVGGATGTLVGGATVSGGALHLDGTGHVQYLSHLVPTSGPYTVSLFVKAPGPQLYLAEFISQGSSGGPGFYIGTDGGNGLRATDSWNNPTGDGTGFAQDNLFHQYALTVGATSSHFYIDGILRGTLGSAIATTVGGTDTRFGNQFEGYTENLVGDIDNVRIYESELSESDIAILAEGGDPDSTTTPEPASLLLLGSGLCGFGIFARRRRSA